MADEAPGAVSLDSYQINIEGQLIDVNIFTSLEGFSYYYIAIQNITQSTNIVLEKIKEEFISRINVGEIEFTSEGMAESIKDKFRKEIFFLIKKYFPGADQRTSEMLINQLIRQNIGLGDIEILLKDKNLEEVVVNSCKEPVWVYHKKWGWLKTNIIIPTEEKVRHYATMIGRDVGKEITVLKPLMDAHLMSGDRVNATLQPISSSGNTITIRKFAVKPWTITDMIQSKTINYPAAALIWLAVQNELSTLITGGTGSGKTSMLNVVCSFIPINQRIISIEDTRELMLPNDLHWVPLETRLPNPEGKGEVSMLDLVVNSLRMRPDRIIMGEIRRKAEAEVLFEAMHTGHSVYGTLHANNVRETIVRLTNPPIDVPKSILSSLSLIVVENRNRRTGFRRVLQVAEMLENGDPNMLLQYDVKRDDLVPVNDSISTVDSLELYTGMSKKQIEDDINEKVSILKRLIKNNVNDVHEVGSVFRAYYNKKARELRTSGK